MSQKKAIASTFDEWAQDERAHNMARGHEHIVDFLLEGIREYNSEAQSLLDVGCGVGYALKAAQKRSFQTLAGSDISSAMVEIAQKQLPEAEIQCAEGAQLAFPAKSFDAYLCVESLYYHDEPIETLREAFRILKQGGVLGIGMDFYKENPATECWADALNLELHFCSEKEWLQWIEQLGFKDVKIAHVQKNEMLAKKDFLKSSFFPTYETYLDFYQKGSLCILARK